MKQDTCCAKLGKPDERNGMRVCGKPVEYLVDDRTGGQLSGWYHHERGQDHPAVPASYAR